MAFQEGYLSEIVGRRVVVETATRPRPIGKVVDLLIGKPDDAFPKIDGFVIKTKDGRRFAPVADILDLDAGGSVLLKTAPEADALPAEQVLYLVEDLLDKQIVDVDGRKVVRINDVEIANTGGALRVVAADIGAGGLLRRLGVRRFAPNIFKRFPSTIIAWDNVAPISDVNPVDVKLSVSEHRLARLHPSELADIIEELSAQDAVRVVRSLDDETAADAFEHLETDKQRELIEDIGTERAADIIEEMDADDAADLLGELDEEQQTRLLAEMPPETAGELRSLVQYEFDTAGGLMTTGYVWIYPHRTVEATIATIRAIAPESEFIYYLYVTDQSEKLLGVLSLRTLLLSAAGATIHSIMDPDLITVRPDTSAEDVTATIARYDLLACPVTDEGGKMLGIVTVDDAIDAIIPERLKKQLPRFTKRAQRRRAEAAS